MDSMLIASYDHHDRRIRKSLARIVVRLKVTVKQQTCPLREPTCVAISKNRLIVGGSNSSPVVSIDMSTMQEVDRWTNKSQSWLIGCLPYEDIRLYMCLDETVRIQVINNDDVSRWRAVEREYLSHLDTEGRQGSWNHGGCVLEKDGHLYYLLKNYMLKRCKIADIKNRQNTPTAEIVESDVACFSKADSGIIYVAHNSGKINRLDQKFSFSIPQDSQHKSTPTAMDSHANMLAVATFDKHNKKIAIYLLTLKLQLKTQYTMNVMQNLEFALAIKFFKSSGRHPVQLLSVCRHQLYVDILAVHRFKVWPVVIKCQTTDSFNYGIIFNSVQNTIVAFGNVDEGRMTSIKIVH